ncbi:hypothetical protein [Flavobacterium sp.]
MKTLIIVMVILFVAVIIVTRMANKQRGNRRNRSFKTNYYSKKGKDSK